MNVSIIVPVLDEHAALPGQLEHLHRLRAEDPGLEIVLVDGGSTDGTREMLRTSSVGWIAAARGRGPQLNAGAAACSGDVLLFLHADTRLPSGGIDAARRAARRGAIGGFFRVRLESDRALLRVVGRLISLRSRLTGIATGDQAIFVSREAFRKIGGYPPLPMFEDVELCRRLRSAGEVVALPETVVTSARRWERLGPWRTIVRMWILRGLYSLGVEPGRLARFYEAPR